MSDDERRKSSLIDFVTVGAVLLTLLLLPGCDRVTETPEGTRAEVAGDTAVLTPAEAAWQESRRLSRELGASVWVDPETDCQYVGYLGHGLTPRMSRVENGKQTQMGCYLVDTYGPGEKVP